MNGTEATFAEVAVRAGEIARAQSDTNGMRVVELNYALLVRVDERCPWGYVEVIIQAMSWCRRVGIEAVARTSGSPARVWLHAPPECVAPGPDWEEQRHDLRVLAAMIGQRGDAHLERYFGAEKISDGEAGDEQLRTLLRRELAEPGAAELPFVVDASPRVSVKEFVHLIDIARSVGVKSQATFGWAVRSSR